MTTESFRNNPSPRREWRLHWKDYTVGLDIPEDWEDVTWHNDELPSFRSTNYHVWMNAPTLEKRQEEYVINGNSLDDYEDWRFAVQLTNADGEIIYQEDGDSDLLRTTDFDEVVAFVRKPHA